MISNTPGPWARSGHREIVSADGGVICLVLSGPCGIEQADANERLIAAAPDLLEALQTMLMALDAPTALHPKFGAQWMGPAIELAGAAIAKATEAV